MIILRFFLLLPLFAILCGLSCQNSNESAERESLDDKTEPYDFFSRQRSYPDRDFDWKGWRKTITRVRQLETEQLRSSGCSGQSTNWTLQGPANIAGRVNTLAVKPDDQNTVLAGFATGGIFKSTDAGLNWHPVFDDNLDLAIGSIAFSTIQPNVVYAGTGDANMPSILFNGNGVYKSSDAGETWSYLGLAEEGIISKIVLHPTNPQILFAATMGNPYVRDAARGVYRSTDGGLNWEQVLNISNQAGASSLVINATNPQILYASFWDRIRNNQESIIYGSHARVYKSTDGGSTWTQLGGGLPTASMGRTGLAISAQNPNKLYVLYIDTLSRPGALYKTIDGGQSWTPMNIVALNDATGDFGWYFGKLTINPLDDEDLYMHAILLWRKLPNSTGWQVASGGHADSHDLVILPSGRRYWANDGGVYRNEPNTMTWIKSKNLPATQLYRTDYNPTDPNNYYAGAQDNGIMKGSGTNLNNWTSIFPADGFHCAFHPTNVNLFWIEIQNGAIHRTTDGQNFIQGQPCLGSGDRCSWDTPFFLSTHTTDRLYAGTYRAYVSSDGAGWGPISGDLTDGNIYGARFHTISCMDESPVLAEKLFAGTTDGNVWRREPNGTWANLSPGLPDRYVTSVHGSPTLSQRIFVTHSGFRSNEYIPHLHRSDNNGSVWTDISGDLPQVPVNDLWIWANHADSVLVAATDAGVYFTRNSGAHWDRLGGNMPYLPTFELELNVARRELIAATFGRGIYTFPIDSLLTQAGTVVVSLAGTVKNEVGTGVAQVEVSAQPLVNTPISGAFSIPGIPGCQSYTLEPYRNDNPLNGVSTFDLTLISNHILGLTPLTSPYKLIAADANKSGSITTFDILRLRKLILGIDSVMTLTNSWRFVPTAYVFPNPLNPFQAVFPETLAVDVQTTPQFGLDFTAIKVGDVNGNANPGLFTSVEDRTAGEWLLPLEDRTFQRGELVEIILRGDLQGLAAAQMTLWFDPAKFRLEKTQPLLAGMSPENFGRPGGRSDLLTLSFETRHNPQPGEQPLFRLSVRALAAGRLSDACRITDNPTPALAFRPDGTALQPVLAFGEKTAVAALQVWPNPVGNDGVWLRLPASVEGPCSVQVFDTQGKVVLERTFLAGEHVLRVAGEVFARRGGYFYRVTAGKERWSGRLVRG